MKFSNIDLKDLACFIYETLKKAEIDVVLRYKSLIIRMPSTGKLFYKNFSPIDIHEICLKKYLSCHWFKSI